jgi:hypothetical protein
MMDVLYEGWMILAALIPSIGLLFLFWVILKHFIEGDRRERAAIRQWEAEQDAAQAAVAPPTADTGDAPQESSKRADEGATGPVDPRG